MSKKAVFLDRDGVLNWTRVENGKPYAPRKVEDFRLLEDAQASTESLKKAGYFLIVVTNQPDVGNGFVEKHVVEEMNKILLDDLPIDDVRVCFHAQTEGCACRKPKPGMLLDAIKAFDIDPAASFMVGDRWGDVAAGKSAGVRTIFLERGYKERVNDSADFHCRNLAEAASYILDSTGMKTYE